MYRLISGPTDEGLKRPIDKDKWKIIGPGGGGTVFTPAISPHDSKTVLCVCDMTGTYITHDDGLTWREINLLTMVRSISFDVIRPGIIYAGSSGVFRSEDNGDTWRLVFPNPQSVVGETMNGDHASHKYISTDNYPGGVVTSIRVDPENSEYICIVIQDGNDLTLCFSNNFGDSWSILGKVEGTTCEQIYIDHTYYNGKGTILVFTDKSIYSVSMEDFLLNKIDKPSDSNILGVACGINPDTGKPVVFVTTNSIWMDGEFHTGVYKSEDLCQSWKELSGGLDADILPPQSGHRRIFTKIDVSENDSRTVYLIAKREPLDILNDLSKGINYLGMFKSTDSGETWQWVLKTGDKYSDNLLLTWQEHSYDTDWIAGPREIDVFQGDPNIVYFVFQGGVFSTLNGGESWEQVYSYDYSDGSVSTRGIDVTTCYGVHFDPHDKEHMVISYTDIGQFHSTNGGRSWKHTIKGVPFSWINTSYWMVFDPDVKERAWSVWSEAHDLPRLKLLKSDKNGMIIDKRTGGVCKTEDGLNSWQVSNTGMPENCVCTHIILDPDSPANNRTLYVAAFRKGVYKSVDDGKTWELKNNNLTENPNAWWLVRKSDGTLFLLVTRGLKRGTERDGFFLDGAIYKSVDGAENWCNVNMPEGITAPNDMVLDPQNEERMYLACWPTTINGEECHGGLYITEDGGISWRNIFNQSAHVFGVTVDESNPSTIFIVTFEGTAFRSDDRGESWKLLGGYDFKWGHRPFVDPYDKDMLYITTFGSSVWYGPANGEDDEIYNGNFICK